MSSPQAESLLGTVAVLVNSVINAEHPLIEAEIPIERSRIGGALPPVVSRATFSIRKRASRVYTLDEYVKNGVLSRSHSDALRAAVAARKNILVAGASGSGKTTFANALLHEISIQTGSNERVVILEEVPELQCTMPNVVSLKTTDHVDMTRLLRATLRFRPDRIIVGEVRGAEALALLKAWNTGHPGGLATIHANDCGASLDRLDLLLEEATPTRMSRLVSEAIDVIVRLSSTEGRRRVSDVASVESWTMAEGYHISPIP